MGARLNKTLEAYLIFHLVLSMVMAAILSLFMKINVGFFIGWGIMALIQWPFIRKM